MRADEALLSNHIADALVAELRKEARALGVDVVPWLMRDQGTDETGTPARPDTTSVG